MYWILDPPFSPSSSNPLQDFQNPTTVRESLRPVTPIDKYLYPRRPKDQDEAQSQSTKEYESSFGRSRPTTRPLGRTFSGDPLRDSDTRRKDHLERLCAQSSGLLPLTSIR